MSENVTVPQKSFGLPVQILVTLVLLGLMAGGVYLTQRGLKSVEQSIASQDWPSVDGVIVRSSVKTTETPIRKNGRDVPNKTSKSYSPDIEYRYSVNGQEYTGTRVTIDDASIGTRDSAQAIVDKYPRDMTLKVSYQPGNPDQSVLVPGSWAGSYRWFVPGGFLFFIPLLLLRGIWFGHAEPTAREVQRDENHPARSRLLHGLLMQEEIVQWEPGKTVHIRRARVGFLKSIFGGMIAGLFFGILLGLLPAIFFLSGRGVIFIAKFYLAVSALISVAFAVGLILWGRRREYLLDWALESIHWEIGWSGREAPLSSIETLMLFLPAKDGPRNHLVDSYRLKIRIQGWNYTLLETNGNGQTWHQVRDNLVRLTMELSDALQVPWTESQDRSVKPRS